MCIAGKDDRNYEIIEKHVGEVISFMRKKNIGMEKGKGNNKKVLFHCLAGVNRSVTLCIAYLLWKTFEEFKRENGEKNSKKKDDSILLDIVKEVAEKRGIGILSNLAFVQQIVAYNEQLRKELE